MGNNITELKFSNYFPALILNAYFPLTLPTYIFFYILVSFFIAYFLITWILFIFLGYCLGGGIGLLGCPCKISYYIAISLIPNIASANPNPFGVTLGFLLVGFI
jgi:hypothetical protein